MGLSPDLELRATCRWALYEVRPHVLSLMNSVSDKYIGMTFGGGIACNSRRSARGSNSTWTCGERRGDVVETPISLLAADWGGAAAWNVIEMGSLGWASRSGTRRLEIELGGGGSGFLDDAYEVPTFADQALTLKPDALEQVRGTVPAVLEEAAATAAGAAARAPVWDD